MKVKTLIASAATVMILCHPLTAVAWHPVGDISKKVQNISATNSALAASEADTDATAVEAKTGDIVRFTITVKNKAKDVDSNYNDLAFIEVTDKIPAGLQLTSDPEAREFGYDVDVLIPGDEFIATFDMKVTANTNGQILINEACFTGDSLVKDKPQSGCDQARVRVVNPQTSSTSTVKPTPVVQAATTLPKTGVSNVFALGAASGVLAYGASLVRQKRRYNH